MHVRTGPNDNNVILGIAADIYWGILGIAADNYWGITCTYDTVVQVAVVVVRALVGFNFTYSTVQCLQL
jgi:hypothetical protein